MVQWKTSFAVQYQKDVRGRVGLAPLILNLRTRWRCLTNFTPNRFTPVKEPPYPLCRMLCDPRNKCVAVWEHNGQIFLSFGIEVRSHDRLVYSLVAVWTVLSWLQRANETELHLKINFVLSTGCSLRQDYKTSQLTSSVEIITFDLRSVQNTSMHCVGRT
jgi:hypothetical protein